MEISFTAPLDRAWRHMKALLFSPFHIENWFVIGFAAWISGLVDGRKGGSPIEMMFNRHGDKHLRLGPLSWGFDRFTDHPILLPLAVMLGIFGVALFVVLLWVSARGRFVFLDNVIQGHTHISEPWARFARRGNSLFLWQLVFAVIVAVAFLLVLVPVMIVTGLTVEGIFRGWVPAGVMLVTIPILVLLAVPMAFIGLMLDDFIVPIMYSRDLSATQAWGEFMPVLRSQLNTFVVYAVLILLLSVGVAFVVSLVGFATCCIGFVIFSIPYIGSVALLPVSVTYRAYSVAFLAQFDERYRILPALTGTPTSSPIP